MANSVRSESRPAPVRPMRPPNSATVPVAPAFVAAGPTTVAADRGPGIGTALVPFAEVALSTSRADTTCRQRPATIRDLVMCRSSPHHRPPVRCAVNEHEPRHQLGAFSARSSDDAGETVTSATVTSKTVTADTGSADTRNCSNSPSRRGTPQSAPITRCEDRYSSSTPAEARTHARQGSPDTPGEPATAGPHGVA